MWIADGMIATELASLIASVFALIGFAMGRALTDNKWRRRHARGARQQRG